MSSQARFLTLGLVAVLAIPAPVEAQRRPQAQPQAQAAQPQVDPGLYSQLRYRHVGPVGNRLTAAQGIPGDANTYYVGAASGGVWKTTDAGLNWEPLFDGQPAQSVGHLALAPSNPNVVWVGTGEAHVRSHISIGNGIYKSLDGGKTWAHMGLDNTGRIARVVIHPQSSEIVFACSQGHSYGPQPERGVYRTTDGGRTWNLVLHVDQNTGCSDLAMDPTNPNILFAGFWQIEIKTWGRESGGSGSGIFKSSDGGTTWKRLQGNGLPTKPVGKVALGIARSNPNHVYALIETGDGVPLRGVPQESGELWTSLNGGDNWTLTSHDRQLAGRTHYYSRVVVSPDDENEAYFLTASFTRSIDGGATNQSFGGGQAPGGDHHDLWIDPTNGNRMIGVNDQGLGITTTRGRGWYRVQLPVAQMYHVTVDTKVPYFLYGNRQDGPSFRVPSNSRTGGFGGGGSIARSEWHSVAGGESGFATPDPEDPDIVWSSASGSGAVGGIVTRMDLKTRQAHHVEVWPVSTGGWPAAELKYRFVWNAPLTISPNDHNKVYVGSQYVHVTTDSGKSWREISPDLTLNDKSRQQMSGGLTPDNIGVEYAGVVFAIAESRLKPGLLWAGTNDGLVHVSQNGGGNWTNVTPNISGLPPWGTIGNIQPSRYDTATAYIAVDFHQVNGRDPHLYRTTDYGRTWRKIVAGIPVSPLSYTHIIIEDPVRRGLLYAGTENALYVSFNNGELWQPLQLNMPHAPVYWMVIQEHFNDLVVGTYGRGFYILDDLSAIQQLTPEVVAANAHLFRPRAAYRFRNIPGQASTSNDPTVGQNPEYGAAINYWLKAAPQGPVTVTIADAQGNAVRTLQGTRNAGVNRIQWDLRNEPTKQAWMRVKPLYADWFEMPPEGRAAGIGRVSVLMPPGRYTVKVAVGGQEFTQPLEVRKDPNSGSSEEEIRTQVARLVDLQTDLNATVDLYNQTELIRAQLQQLNRTLSADGDNGDVRSAADSLEQKFIAFEENVQQLRTTGRGQDGVRWPAKLAGRIGYLANGMASSDFAPTTQQVQVHELFKSELRALQQQLGQLITGDLSRFNDRLRQRNIPNIVTGAAQARMVP